MDLLDIIKKHFPDCTGAILAGSYLTKNYTSSLSDVDILVFDSVFSTVSPLGVFYNGIMIDFTLIPLNDIDNVLRNEQFDQRGILLTMIVKGNIIKDTSNEIVLKIKSKAERLFNEGIHNNLQNYKALIKGLQKIRKEFSKSPKPYQRIFLINEFFYLVTQIELIKTANWRMTGRHKADYLQETKEAMVIKLFTLIDKAGNKADDEGYREIGIFIDHYLTNIASFDNNRVFGNRFFIIDFDYENISMEHFANVFLTHLSSSDLLSKSYRYFYMSNPKRARIYKNKLSICFDMTFALYVSDFENEILKEFDRIMVKELKLGYRYTITPTFELNEVSSTNKFFSELGAVFHETSKLMVNLISTYKKYEVKRHLIISLIINSYLIEYLDIEKKDLLSILYYLSSRYVINKQEQIRINPKNISNFKKDKYNYFHNYFKDDDGIFIEAVEKGKSIYKHQDSIEDKLYAYVIEELSNFLANDIDYNPGILKENYLTLEVLSTIVKKSDLNNCLIFVLLFDYLQPLFLLNPDQITLQLIILSEINKKESTIPKI